MVDIVEDDAGRAVIPGGSAANVALGLVRRGLTVELATYLGSDENGNLIATFLGREGVDFSHDAFEAARTSTAIAHRSESGDVRYEFDVDWRPRRLDVPEGVLAVHLGSFPAFHELETNLDSQFAELRHRAWTSFDPNIRPELLPDRDLVVARFEQLCTAVDVLKLSDEDAAYLVPGRSVDQVLDRALETGVRLAVITAGGRGLTLATTRDRVHVPAPHAVIVDTIGAGDTIMTSLIVDIVRAETFLDHHSLAAMGERAAAAAAITVARAGANLPYTRELPIEL